MIIFGIIFEDTPLWDALGEKIRILLSGLYLVSYDNLLFRNFILAD